MLELNSMDIINDFDLSAYNCFAVSCRAQAFCAVSDNGMLMTALEYASENSLPLLVLGGGSNVLFSGDFPGLVIHIRMPGITVDEQDEESLHIRIGAGENWHQLVMYCLNNGFYGIENLALIPGTVGAAPIQNIGAYGVELEEVFTSLEALEVASGERWTFDREACAFGYRDSIFKHGRPGELIVTSVTLQLSRSSAPKTDYQALQLELEAMGVPDSPSPEQVAEAVMAIRRRKLPDPAVLPNCGSFFKNPVVPRSVYEGIAERFDSVPSYSVPQQPDQVKVPAAWLLDKVGWKGHRKGPCGVHKDQAVVLVNYGGASGAQLLDLARDMQLSVLDKFGITLEPEVRIL
ncbi:MAG: UDP-N-acetylmuramate dehydrogenase [Gammaproteobacteria bacterium]|nr:UDP-N-acetylmuramate dehydrogenase [Gammaproteobacteria bacterium]